MEPYITNIHVNELFHLKDFDIKIADANHPHLMITGKNGNRPSEMRFMISRRSRLL